MAATANGLLLPRPSRSHSDHHVLTAIIYNLRIAVVDGEMPWDVLSYADFCNICVDGQPPSAELSKKFEKALEAVIRSSEGTGCSVLVRVFSNFSSDTLR